MCSLTTDILRGMYWYCLDDVKNGIDQGCFSEYLFLRVIADKRSESCLFKLEKFLVKLDFKIRGFFDTYLNVP